MLLQSQANAQRAVDTADDFALPFEDVPISTEKATEATRGNRVNDCAKEPDEREDETQNCKLHHNEAIFRGDKLRQEGQEEQRGLRIRTSARNACLKA